MKYFKVTAKCGHVGGTHKYIPIDFFCAADTASLAAGFVRKAPRVKHHQKDAIMDIVEISYEDYLKGGEAMCNDPFLNCTSKQQQDSFGDEIYDRVCDEKSGRYTPWINKYKNYDGTTRYNRKKSVRYGYKNDYLLQTKGSFDYRDYLFEDTADFAVA